MSWLTGARWRGPACAARGEARWALTGGRRLMSSSPKSTLASGVRRAGDGRRRRQWPGVLGTAATADAAIMSRGATWVAIFGGRSCSAAITAPPGFLLLDVFQQYAWIGQPIILHRASTSDPAEDFRLEFWAPWPTSPRPGW